MLFARSAVGSRENELADHYRSFSLGLPHVWAWWWCSSWGAWWTRALARARPVGRARAHRPRAPAPPTCCASVPCLGAMSAVTLGLRHGVLVRHTLLSLLLGHAAASHHSLLPLPHTHRRRKNSLTHTHTHTSPRDSTTVVARHRPRLEVVER